MLPVRPISVLDEVGDRAADRLRVETALSYPEDTAGGLMNTDVITIRGDVDVDVVLRYLRMKGELPEATDALYVIDDDSKLIGELPITTLITTQPDVKVSEVMTKNSITANPDTLAVEALNLMEENKINSMFAVDDNGKAVGALNMHILLKAGVV